MNVDTEIHKFKFGCLNSTDNKLCSPTIVCALNEIMCTFPAYIYSNAKLQELRQMKGCIRNDQDHALAEQKKEIKELDMPMLHVEEVMGGKEYVRCGNKTKGSARNLIIKFMKEKEKRFATCDCVQSLRARGVYLVLLFKCFKSITSIKYFEIKPCK